MSAERVLRWLIMAAFTIAGAVFIGAPILGLSWSAKPFPGFVVEQTLVVADYDGKGWTGTAAGLGYPQYVVQIDDRAVASPAEFEAALAGLPAGQEISVHVVLPDGMAHVYPAVMLARFPGPDLMRLFWLPYGVGLSYLAIGAWVYALRGNTGAGRAFAIFCVCTAIASGLLFDLITTHVGPALWSTVMAMAGSTLISLVLLFPEESSAVQRRPWLSLLPYGLSILLAGRSLLLLNSPQNPWVYVSAWRTNYVYTALGIVALIGVMAYRQATALSATARQQARVVLWGSLIAFAPVSVFFVAPLFGVLIRFNTLLFMPFLLFFPLSIAFAILRYRLWDIDVIIHRTLVYGVLTVILGSVYLGSVMALQALFGTMTGQTSPLAVAASTLVIALLFNPLRRRVQAFIDRRFYRQKYDAAQALAAFGATLRDQVDLSQLVRRLQAIVGEVLHPARVSLWLNTARGFGLLTLRMAPGEEAEDEVVCDRPIIADDPIIGQDAIVCDDSIAADDPVVSSFHAAPGAVQLDRLGFDSPALARLRSADVQMVVPFVSQGELIGWLGLGPRLSEQEYSLDDRALLRDLATQAAPAVRVAQLVRERQAKALEQERLEREMRFARLIQQALLPQEIPAMPGWRVAVHWQPARAVGGDFYDFLVLPDGRLFLTIADVADKGVGAALIMATTRAILRGTARHMYSPGEALARANELLVPEVPMGMFVTCLYAILDPVSGRLQYANAGHNWPYRRHNGQVSELRASGMALGVMPDMQYEEHETIIAPSECLLLYSDGLTEAHNPQGEMFDFPRLQALMAHNASSGPELIDYLLAELARFTGSDWEQEDDMTIVTLQRTGDGREGDGG